MERLKAIIFDLDGTLIDSKRAYYILFQEVLKENGINFSKRKLWKELNGQKDEEVFSKILRGVKKSEIEKLCNQLRKKEIEKGIRLIKPIKNAKEIVDFYRKRIKVYLLTNSDRKFVTLILKKFGLKFNGIFSRENFKDKSEVIKKIVNSLGATPKEIIYVGDTVRDIRVARKAKCKVVIIPNWSPKYLVKKERPDFLLTSITQLKKLFT
jgi:HAD superfamily hydrolase (TIGR01549 family)